MVTSTISLPVLVSDNFCWKHRIRLVLSKESILDTSDKTDEGIEAFNDTELIAFIKMTNTSSTHKVQLPLKMIIYF